MSPLTYIIGWPLLMAVILAFIPRNYRVLMRLGTLLATFLSLLVAVKMFVQFGGAEVGLGGYRFVQQVPWVESLGISYYVGVDGINVGLILMGALVAFAAACVSWEIKTHEKEYYLLLLVMTGGILGAFSSLDLFFFYFFHELALVPTFIMIGIWGRGADRNFATFQITMYLTVGALIALAGLVLLYLEAGLNTFDLVRLTEHLQNNPLKAGAQNFIFPFLLFGFGILVSLWPFHSWAPVGYGSAPTATAMLHAGVLKKFGLYGLIKIALPLLPNAAQGWVHVIAALAVGNILYCGWVAMRQRDLNLLIGNSSVAHMGFTFLGLASLTLIGITGAVTVMIAHGLLAALTFGLSGYIYNETGTLDTRKLGGLLRPMPFIGTAMVMAMMAGCGLPGFANFAGELLVLFGAWNSLSGFVVAAAWGALVVGAVYMLRAVRNVVHGPLPELERTPRDANAWRKLPFVLLLAALLWFGIFPSVLVNKIKPDAARIVKMVTGSEEPATAQAMAALKRGDAKN
ncbi:MAG TPA: proton-translocating NADH-quinone oxidoreductase subunit M [Verrucomicrobiales bacterium]|nr:proton-translocating NADH-quinone oxidoreductase subunit M [Verrucomicrobiales bacterium]